MSALLQALCCICGQLRTCSRPRNRRLENFWFAAPINRDWHRETGDLKCSACGEVTTHALIYPDRDAFRNHAEQMQLVALGWTNTNVDGDDLVRARRQYHDAFPSNPYMRHMWWKSAENEARERGESHFPARCGEMVPVPAEAREGRDIVEFRAPLQLTDPRVLEHEQLDVDTGTYWDVGDCVNCLRVRNVSLLNDRRKELRLMLIAAIADADKFDGQLVTDLIDLLRGSVNCD